MKHYIWLSLLLALGVVQAEDKPEEAKEEVATTAPEAPAEDAAATEKTEAPADDASPEKTEETPAEDAAAPAEDTSTEESPKKSKRKGKKNRKLKKTIKKGRKHIKNSKNKKKGKGNKKGGRNVQTPSASVLNAYMNRVQSGEMYSAGPASMSAMPSDQGGCATGACGLPAPEATTEAAA